MNRHTVTAPLCANYHTHTPRCRHAQGTEREYIEAAIRAGIRTLGFSDHAPMLFDDGFVSDFRMLPEETENYVTTLGQLKREYAGEIGILIGYEMEYYPRYFARSLSHILQYEVDYLILGQHFFENEYPHERAKNRSDGYSGAATDEEWKLAMYADRVIAGLETGTFSCVAHPDLMPYCGDASVYRHHMQRLCQTAASLDIPLEINLLGLGGGRFYPHEPFWDIAAACGCHAVIGCDAHNPAMLDVPDVLARACDLADRHGIALDEQILLRDPRIALYNGVIKIKFNTII